LHAFAALPVEDRLQIGREYAAHLAAEDQAKAAAAPAPRPAASKVLAALRAKAGKSGPPA
jgi:hypothetical protein